MLQVARLAPGLLQEASDRVGGFFREQFNEDGGARDRAGKSDLYYTVFGLEGLIALRQEPPFDRVRPYLERFGDGEGLDLVHLSCLARSWAALPRGSLAGETARRIAARIESHRAPDGGYGSLYHGFLALGALQDLGMALSDPAGLARSVASLEVDGGAFSNQPGIPAGTTPTTAAAATVLRTLGASVPPATSEWLLRQAAPKGGFLAVPGAPMPDLLSTATALHALAGLHAPLGALKDACLDFVDTLWTGRAFCGNWADDVPDGEYTYYALLSLGHLSLA